ncbi:MAG: ROK family protein [Clostridia bacterium]|nr:ROK family protein [Clostridia bacterium]
MQTNFEIKKSNTLRFFRTLRQQSPLSRKELERLTGLSWGSISAISSELLQKNLILAEKESATTGRPPERLAVNPSVALSLGIDINSVGLSLNVVNIVGASLHAVFVPLPSAQKEDLLATLKTEVHRILELFPALIGINLSMQGKLNRKTGESIRTNFFTDWKNVPLVQFFEEEFHIPTVLYHDPEALLTYHMHADRRLREARNCIVIRVDDGIGMAQLFNGQLYETGEDTSCELGHTIAVPNGIQCACGKHGCLEAYSSLRGMKAAYARKSGRDPEEFPIALAAQDEIANAVMDEACRYLGIAVANLFTLFDVDSILIDGLVPAQLPRYYERTQDYARAYLNADCNLLQSSYKRDAAAIGACLLTTEKRLEEIIFDDSMYPV